MPQSASRPRVPEYYRCANGACGRNLLVSGYRIQRVPSSTAADRVHRVVESEVHPFAVLCSCSHYTFVAPWRETRIAQ